MAWRTNVYHFNQVFQTPAISSPQNLQLPSFKLFSVIVTILSTSSFLETSAFIKIASLPFVCISKVVFSAPFLFKSTTITFTPFSAKDNEQDLPIPLAAPVTIATLSLNKKYLTSFKNTNFYNINFIASTIYYSQKLIFFFKLL